MKASSIRLVFLLGLWTASASAQPIINTTLLGSPALTAIGYSGDTAGNTIDDDQDGAVDEPDLITRRHSVGQTFRLLPGFPILDEITFLTQDTRLFGDARDLDATYKVIVMAWDEASSRPIGNVLFQSLPITPLQNGISQNHVVAVGGLLLEAGRAHVAFMILEIPEPTSGNHSLSNVLSRDGDPYVGGQLVTKTGGSLGLAGVSAEAWSVHATKDLSIKVTASPLPVGFTNSSGTGVVSEIRFGTSGDIPGNNIDDNQNGAVDEGFFPPLHQHTIGQTFLVPAAAGFLQSVIFTFRDSAFSGVNPSADKTARFVLSIAEWDPLARQPTGPVLFESEVTGIPQSGAESPFLFDSLNLEVSPGKVYIAYASVENLGLGTGNHSLCKLLVRSDNPFPGGGVFLVADNARDPGSLTAGPWVESTADLVGAITFSAGNPGADSNGDGVTDALVANYGLDPAIDYTAVTSAVRASQLAAIQANPTDFGLYDADSIQDLRFGGLLFQKTGTGVNLSFEIETSEELTNWDIFETINRDVPLASDKAFLRVRVTQPGEN